MRLTPRKNGLTSLFKEVRVAKASATPWVFSVWAFCDHMWALMNFTTFRTSRNSFHPKHMRATGLTRLHSHTLKMCHPLREYPSLIRRQHQAPSCMSSVKYGKIRCSRIEESPAKKPSGRPRCAQCTHLHLGLLECFLAKLFLIKLVRISRFSSIFLAIAVFLAHFAREC